MNIADVSQVRAAEKKALAGDPEGYGLMLRAGRAAARIIQSFFPRVRRTVVLCGGGNNGGDALVAASSLPGEVVVYALKPLSELRGAAACAARDLPGHVEVRVCETLSPDVFRFGDLYVCGTRGWTAPESSHFKENADRKLYERELIRLDLSLGKLKKGAKAIGMLHYPPFSESGEKTAFAKRFELAGVKAVVYGHLHGASLRYAFSGEREGIAYHCVSADGIDFVPKRIL